MVLSKGDDFPIHQTAEPIAYSGTDRNFYDRYFFNGYAPDGSGFFALALGIYPHLDIADAHFNFIRGDTQYCLHASCEMGMERMAMRVGSIAIEVLEPLNKLRVRRRAPPAGAETPPTLRDAAAAETPPADGAPKA